MTDTVNNEAQVPESESGAKVSRRTFCMGAAGVVAMLGLGCVKFVPSRDLVRPPGGQDENAMIASCLRCQKCFDVCPKNIIRPAHIEDGIVTMRTPYMDFSENWCDFCEEENGGVPLCVQCCPSGALNLPEDATAENTIIGVAVIDTETCLAYRLKGCHYCVDACPFEAISLDENLLPVMDETLCTGCGACESVCVSLQDASIVAGATRRAIYIEPCEQ